MKIWKSTYAALLFILLSFGLAACGGGGGNAGTGTGTSTGTSSTTTKTPTLSPSVQGTGNTIAVSGTTVQVTLLDANGVALPNTVVQFTGDDKLIRFLPATGAVLTNANGVASIQVISIVSGAAGESTATTIKMSALVGTTTITGGIDVALASGSISTTAPTLTPYIQGVGTTGNVIAVGGSTVQATLLDAKGLPVPNTLVQFTGDNTLIRFSPVSGAVLTNASGIASVQVTSIVSSSAGGSTATTIKSSALVGTTTVTGGIDVSLSPVQTANLSLSLGIGTGSMNAYGNQAITATVTADGKVLADPATVTFSASCGKIDPISSQTNSSGIAGTTYIADKLSCAGTTVTISATIEGSAKTTTGSISVKPALATNLLFSDATPKVIYLAGSTGATQSQVTFKVVDAQSNTLLNQPVKLSLTNTGPGVSFHTVGNTGEITLTTDNNGQVSVPVFSGTVPTTAQIKAELAADANVYTNSNILTVASGAPVQRALSLALETLSVEGFDIDGIETKVTLSMADRQGNPVPDGTAVNFTASSGVMIPATCYASDGASRCTVTWRSSGTRPNNGKVAVFAQLIGEEDFTDTNGNNIFDANEVFTDLGNAYRDNNFSGTWDLGEFYVPRAGSSICAGGENGKTNTCDGKWGAADVRKQAILIAAKSKVDIAFNPTAPAIVPGAKDGDTQTPGGRITLQDDNSNSPATGSEIIVTAIDNTDAAPSVNAFIWACTLTTTPPDKVPNQTSAYSFDVGFKNCIKGDQVSVKVVSPGKVVSSQIFTFNP